MQTVLIVIHLLVVIALIATVLLQRSEGGALGIGSGGSGAGGFFTGRGQANALTRATAILATLFFITSLSLTVLASYSRSQKSIFESPAATSVHRARLARFDRARPCARRELGHLRPGQADGRRRVDADREKDRIPDRSPSPRACLSPPAAAESTRAAPDAAQPKGTVLDQLKQMEKNAPPPSPGSGQAPPRAR